jgi:HEAT repeat protein
VRDLRSLLSDLLSGEDALAEAAVEALVAHGEQAFFALGEALSSPDPEQRWWAVRAIAGLESEEVPGALIRALEDPEAVVRQCAALGLRHRPVPQAVGSLCRALDDPDALTARLAGDALIAAGQDATSELLSALQGGGAAARIEAVRALAKIADPRSIPALYSLVDDDSALVRHWAEEGLEKMGVGMVYFKP